MGKGPPGKVKFRTISSQGRAPVGTVDRRGRRGGDGKAKGRWRVWGRRVLIGAGVGLGLLVCLILLVPTIAGLGPVRSFVLGKVNENLNGKLSVDDWSLGWLEGVTVRGVTLQDAGGTELVSLTRLHTDVSFVRAIFGTIDLGKTSVENLRFHVKVNEDGTTAFDTLARKSDAPAEERPKDAGGGGGLPDVRVQFDLDGGGVVELPGRPALTVDSVAVHVGVTDLERPVEDAVKVRFRLGDGPAGEVSVAGTATVCQAGRTVDVAKLAAKQTVKVEGVDLSAAAPFLKASDPTAEVGGVVRGELTLSAEGLTGAAVTGELGIDAPLVGGGMLKGDTFRAGRLTVPVDVGRRVESDGVTKVTVRALGVEIDQVKLAVEGEFTEEGVRNLAAGRPAGREGRVSVRAGVGDFAVIANQLPHLLSLAGGVTVTAGSLAQELDAEWSADSVTVSARTDVRAEGTNRGRDVRIEPVTLALKATARPVADGVPELGGLTLDLKSGFLTVDGKAESLGSLKVKGELSLDRLVEQAGQFADLGALKVAGRGHFDLTTAGDVTDPAKPIDANFALDLENIHVSGLAGREPVVEPRVSVSAGARVDRLGATPVEQLRRIALRVKSRSGVLEATGDSVAAMDVKGDFDLATVMRQAAPFVDLGKLRVGGRARIAAGTRGDVTRPGEPIRGRFRLDLDGVSVAGADGVAPVENLATAVDVGAELERGADGTPQRVKGATFRCTVGNESEPSVEVAARADVDVAHQSVPAFELSRFAIDLPRVRRDLGALVPATGGIDVSKGEVTASVAGAFDGDAVRLTRPLVVRVGDVTVGRAGGGTAPVLDGETVTLTVDAGVGLRDGLQATVSTLSVASSSGLLDVGLADGRPVVVKVGREGSPVAEGAVSLKAQLGRLARIGAALSGATGPAADPVGADAALDCRVDLAAAADGGAGVKGLVELSHLTVPPYLSDGTVRVTADARAAAGMREVGFKVGVQTPVARVAVDNGRYVLKRHVGDRDEAVGLWDALAGVDVAVEVPSLPAVYAMVAGGAAQQPNGLAVESGQVDLRVSVKREGETTVAEVGGPGLTKLSVKNAGVPVIQGDVPLGVKVAIDARDEAGKSVPQQIRSITLTDLRAALGFVTAELSEPIVARDLDKPRPTVTGGIRVRGGLAALMKVAGAFAGPGAKLPAVAGDYDLTENLSTADGRVRMLGGLKVTDVDARQDGKALLAERSLELANDLDVDLATRTATAKSVKFAMASGAAGFEARGGIRDWAGSRELVGVRLGLDYDLAKLWAIAKPALSPEQQAQLKDLRVEGRHHSDFEVAGSLPAGADPLKVLTVKGGLTVGAVDFQTYKVRDLVVPLFVKGGVVHTAYDEGGKTAEPAKFNGGKLDVGGIAADLNGPAPRFTVPRNKAILSDVRVDAPLATDMLGKFCPLFADTKEASGRLSFTVVDCRDLDPNELLKPAAPSGKRGARLEVLLNIADLKIVSGMTQVLLGLCDPGAFDQPGGIKDGRVIVENGLVKHDITLALAQGYEIGLKGTVRIEDQRLMPLNASISKKLLQAVKLAGPKVYDSLPDKIEIAFEGTASSPKAQTDSLTKLIRDTAIRSAISLPSGGDGGGLPSVPFGK